MNASRARFSLKGPLQFISCFGASLAVAVFAVGCSREQPASSKISFNETIQPILSENCYGCHGPSSSSRKAGLRLDHAETAYAPHEKFGPAIIPGKPDKSPLVHRIEAKDPEERMPPPEAHKTLKPQQIALLRQWIAEGAHYEPHWSFIAPKWPAAPKLAHDDWSRNDIDRFVFAKLRKEGLAPSAETDRRSLIRRVTYALTGLPPTPQEVEAFLADAAPNAYEKVVDRLLASPRYGEQRAHYWLDYVRYADTHGIHFDNYRAIWPYRDYVVHAFNSNKRFDTFVREQLAGDLLPARTPDELIATGYIRSNLTTNEAGTIPEELLANVGRDRVENFGVTFLGLTTGCAVCHDHKFDPTTQKDVYQLAALLNNTVEPPWDNDIYDPPPSIRLPEEKNRAEFDAVFAERADLEQKLAVRRRQAAAAFRAWLAAGHRPLAVSPDKLELRLRLDEAQGDELKNSAPKSMPSSFKVSAGALVWGEQSWLWPAARFDMSTRVPLPGIGDVEASEAFSGGGWFMVRGLPHHDRNIAGALFTHMHDEPHGAGRGWELYWDTVDGPGYLMLRLVSDPSATPLHMADKPSQQERRGLEQRLRAISPPQHGIMVVTHDSVPKNVWLHLFFTYDGSGKASGVHLFVNGRPMAREIVADSLRPGQTIRTNAVTQLGRRDDGEALPETRYQDIRFYRRELKPDEVARLPFEDIAAEIIAHKPDPAAWLPEEGFVVLQQFFLAQDSETQKLTSQIAALDQRLDKLAPPLDPPELQKSWHVAVRDYNEELTQKIQHGNQLASKAAANKFGDLQELLHRRPISLIAQERVTPAYAYTLKRGDYASRVERVGPDTPHFLPALPADAPHDRLALANWLFTPEQPLFARVAVNRMWQEVFGQGLVESSGDFGVMGDRPANPALLDWLAVQFRESGWDVKRLYKLMVMSATYRQSARATPALLEKDPANRLLARGPRFRMDAEAVRDSALAVSGLLVEKIGGPPVKPYQPSGVWQESAIDTSNTSVYPEDHGPDLYRRSLYTFWKRSSPPPNLDVFDAPSREIACPRRARADTPLQALATMNDPQFVEASRKLAERTLHEAHDASARLSRIAELTLSRPLDPAEQGIIERDRVSYAHEFQAQPKAARDLLTVGESSSDPALDPVELAQWTMVSSEFLNLDEFLNQ